VNGEVGIIYLLHLHRPLAHAGHYKGWCKADGLERRIKEHRTGYSGAKFMEAVAKAGIGFDLAVTWEGTRDDERRFKAHGAARYCPLCTQYPRMTWMKGRMVHGGLEMEIVLDSRHRVPDLLRG
jgi:hypothetical protein